MMRRHMRIADFKSKQDEFSRAMFSPTVEQERKICPGNVRGLNMIFVDQTKSLKYFLSKIDMVAHTVVQCASR